MDDPQLSRVGPTDHKDLWIGNVLYTEDRSGLHRIHPHREELDRDDGATGSSAARRGWRSLFDLRQRIRPR